MSEENLEKVFDRFYQVDISRTRSITARGSGLGLSLARELAGAVGAEIKLFSTEGVGTEACIILPQSRLESSARSLSPLS
ncbi:ATP-binding protein [Paenibacillus sp. AN1007]|uniref:histidine kinase n=1 Tax=Paenibacillus sp. AN1007 TaxID=3151385 RepID=A0AAU8NFF7_9BACL